MDRDSDGDGGEERPLRQRRIKEEGDSVPGSQDTASAAIADRGLLIQSESQALGPAGQ